MSEKMKNYLGLALIVGVLATSFAAWSYARSYGDSIEPSSFRSFTVTGEGKVVAVPDVAAFTFTVISDGAGSNIAKLQAINTEASNRAIAFVKEQGVDSKDVKTEGYVIEPQYQYYNCPNDPWASSVRACPPPDIVGYKITQTVSVKVRDFSKIGTIFSGVVDAGANSLSQLNFTLDEPTAVQNEAREKAIKQAREKAQLVARAGGFGVGRLLNIEEGGIFPYYRMDTFAAKESIGFGGASVAPAIEPGSQEVMVQVTLRYEIR